MKRVLFHLLDTFDHHVLRHRFYRVCCLIGFDFPEGQKCGVGFLDRWVERRETYWKARHGIEVPEDLSDEEYERYWQARLEVVDLLLGGFLVP